MNAAEPTRDFATILAEVAPKVEKIIARYPVKRSALLPILHAFQEVEGWVSPEALAATAGFVDEPLSVVESTASFYTLFFRAPVGRYMLQPCRGIACVINGADDAMAHFRERLGIGHLATTEDGLFSYEEVECLAACDRAPCMQINLEFVHDLTPEKIDALLAELRGGQSSIPAAPQSVRPGKTWHAEPEPARRSIGAQGVADADSPGGLGDVSGERALERIIKIPEMLRPRPSNERAPREGKALVDGRAKESR